MKKYLAILLLFASSNLYADSVTPGTVGLLLPTTGAIDTSRSWADKYNKNFSILASTVGQTMSNLSAYSSSADTRMDTIGQATGTLSNNLSSLGVKFQNTNAPFMSLGPAVSNQSGSSITATKGAWLYQLPGGSITIQGYDPQVSITSGAIIDYRFRVSSGVNRMYDSVISTNYATIGGGNSSMIWSSTWGINGGNSFCTSCVGLSSISINGNRFSDSTGGTTGKVTIELWVAPTKASAGNEEFGEKSESLRGWILRRNASDGVNWQVSDGAGTAVSNYTSTNGVINTNRLNHVVCAYDGSRPTGAKSYCMVNGNYLAQGSADTGGVVSTDINDITIGSAENGSRAFQGYFSQITVYEWALSTGAISNNFKSAVVRAP